MVQNGTIALLQDRPYDLRNYKLILLLDKYQFVKAYSVRCIQKSPFVRIELVRPAISSWTQDAVRVSQCLRHASLRVYPRQLLIEIPLSLRSRNALSWSTSPRSIGDTPFNTNAKKSSASLAVATSSRNAGTQLSLKHCRSKWKKERKKERERESGRYQLNKFQYAATTRVDAIDLSLILIIAEDDVKKREWGNKGPWRQ